MGTKIKFVNKKMPKPNYMSILAQEPQIAETEAPASTATPKNKNKKKDNTMNSMDSINLAENLAKEMSRDNVKVVKTDRGLIERTESSKIILTEEGRQVLND